MTLVMDNLLCVPCLREGEIERVLVNPAHIVTIKLDDGHIVFDLRTASMYGSRLTTAFTSWDEFQAWRDLIS